MLEGVTQSGFAYSIEDGRLTNYELLEALSETQTNPLGMPKVVNLLLGEQANELKDHCRDEKGFVSAQEMEKEIMEIFEAQKTLKNS